jgi:hypothetical protein
VNTARAIGRLATGTYTVTRRPAAGVLLGRAVPGVPTTFPIVASVQDPTGRDLLRLPEERRSKATRVVFTTSQLVTGAQKGEPAAAGGANEADLVQIDGVLWEVQHVETWHDPRGGPDAFRAVVQAHG